MSSAPPSPPLLAALFATALVVGCAPPEPQQTSAAATTFEGWDFYWGDLHAHTGLSADGISSDVGGGCGDCGALATVIEDARDAAGLDFLSLTEHGNGHHRVPDDQAWDQQLADLLAADDPAGGFVTVPGMEIWTWHRDDGTIRDHRNLHFFGDAELLGELQYSELLPVDEEEPITTDDCSALYQWLEDLEQQFGPVLWIPHHPGLAPPAEVEWDCLEEAYSPVVENYSQHGNSQTPSFADGWDPVWSNEMPIGMVDRALSRDDFALQIGVLGGTDSHDTRPGSVNDLDPQYADHGEQSYGGGLAGVVLWEGEPFDRTALYDALRERRTLSTSGPRIPVKFTMWIDHQTEGKSHWANMGDEPDEVIYEHPIGFDVQVPLEFEAYVTVVDLVMPGAGALAMVPDGNGTWSITPEVEHELLHVAYARLRIDGAAFWAAQGVENDDGGVDDEERIWTSPIWFSVVGPFEDDDGGDDDTTGDDDTAPDDDDDDGCECRTSPGGGSGTAAGTVAVLLLAACWRRRQP